MSDILERLYAVPETGADPELIEAAAEHIEELQTELNEQCRLLGMSAERELKLIAEIERLRRYIDALHGKVDVRHRYNGLCPDETRPESRDDECPACLLLTPTA